MSTWMLKTVGSERRVKVPIIYLEGASPGRWGWGREVGQGKIFSIAVLADAFLKLWGITSVSATYSLGSVLLQEPRRGHILEQFLGERKGGWIYLLTSLPYPFYLGKTIYHEVPNSTSFQADIFQPWGTAQEAWPRASDRGPACRRRHVTVGENEREQSEEEHVPPEIGCSFFLSTHPPDIY